MMGQKTLIPGRTYQAVPGRIFEWIKRRSLASICAATAPKKGKEAHTTNDDEMKW